MPAMCGEDFKCYQERCRRQKAWSLHYEAKGCNSMKALSLAHKKVNRKDTWPPSN